MTHSTMPNDADIFETLRQELRSMHDNTAIKVTLIEPGPFRTEFIPLTHSTPDCADATGIAPFDTAEPCFEGDVGKGAADVRGDAKPCRVLVRHSTLIPASRMTLPKRS